MDESPLQNALRLRRAGKFTEAAAVYGEILKSDPKHFEALHALGIVRYQSGQLEEAERLIGEAIAVKPAPDALYNRGSLLQRLNRIDEALICFDRAIAAKPDYVEALTNRGGALMQLGRFEEAQADFERVVQLRPSLAQVWRNRAGACEALGRFEDALTSLEKVLQFEPLDAAVQVRRANLLLQLNRAHEAEEAYTKYLAAHAGDAEAWNRCGIAAAQLKRKEKALACFDRAVALDPVNADFWNNRANALFEAKRYADAAVDYAKALAIVPDLPYAEGYLAQCRLRCCEWSTLREDRAHLAEGVRAGKQVIDPLGNLSLIVSPEDQLRCVQTWIADGYSQVQQPIWQGEIYRHDKIRVAYLSADFRLHPVAYLITGVFEHHDRERFETIGISFTPPGDNAMRTRIEKGCDRFYDVREKTDEHIATLLRTLEVDIAVDLMGFTDGSRLGILSSRPAPVQVNYLGFPGTLGASHIDYILADKTVIRETDTSHYSEQVVYLPGSYLPNDSKRAISGRALGRADAGLPETGFVFCSFNDSHKFSPEIFNIWMRLLKEIEGSALWLPEGNPVAMGNLRREAQARGILAERLLFAPYLSSPADHLARLSLADLFLDTLPYNAHASACDALWAGVPVLTCTGNTFAGRVATSALNAVGLPELATASFADYEALGLKIAREPGFLPDIKAKLARNRTTYPLFDTARFTSGLEAAYRTMWERAQRGEQPAGFEVPRAP